MIVPGAAYHITHRGNRGAPVFFDDEDRDYYRHWLRKDADRWGLDVWAYCLMTNHVHLVGTGHKKDSLRRVLCRSQSRYARWINRRYGWTGHLWENRFYSSLLDVRHFSNAVRYVELNPVRASLVQRAEDYRWSSARAHCLGCSDSLLATQPTSMAVREGWSAWLEEGLPEAAAEELRRNTATGRPTAERASILELEARLQRDLIPKTRGRKPNSSRLIRAG